MKEAIYGNLSAAEYEKLVKQHGKLKLIELGEEGEEKTYLWFKKPDIKTLSAASRYQETDPVQAAQIFFKNCLVHGEAALADDVDVFSSVAPLLQQLIERKVATIKNF